MQDSDSMVEMLRQAAVDFLGGRAGRERLRGTIAQVRPVDRALWQESAELGWCGMLLPESMGGLGLGLAEATALAEVAGSQLYAEPLVAATVLPALLLGAAETGPAPDLAATLAETLTTGERLLTLAWQEAPGQLQPTVPGCQVVDGRLSGSKCFVPACEADAVLLVWAQAAGEPVLVAVQAQAPGVQRHAAAAGLGAQYTLTFDQAPLLDPRPLLQGAAAQQALERALAAGRLALSAELVGLASACLAQTLEHVRTRQQFDRTLGSFQSVQHRCVDLYVEIELARASLQQALSLYTAQPTGSVSPELDAALCAAKARAGEAAVRVGRESVQMHGAMGFCDEVDIGLYLRAALHGNAWLGGPVALRRRFAAALAATPAPTMETSLD